MARRFIRAKPVVRLLLTGMALGQIGQVILVARLWPTIFAAATIAVLAVCAVVLNRRATRAELFI